MTTHKSTTSAPVGAILTVGEGSRPLIDEGMYPARICLVADLGVQPGFDTDAEPKRQIAVSFELQSARSDGDVLEERPILSRRFSAAWGRRALLPGFLRAVLGRDAEPNERLDMSAWINAPVVVMIEHKTRTDGGVAARIATIARSNIRTIPKLDVEPLVWPGCERTDLPEWIQTALDNQLVEATVATPAKSKAKRAPKAKPRAASKASAQQEEMSRSASAAEGLPRGADDLGDVPH